MAEDSTGMGETGSGFNPGAQKATATSPLSDTAAAPGAFQQKEPPPPHLTSLGMGAFSFEQESQTPKVSNQQADPLVSESSGAVAGQTVALPGVPKEFEARILSETVVQPPIAREQTTAPPASPFPPPPPPPPAPSKTKFAEKQPVDYARILEEIKLPERRDFRASADLKPPSPKDAVPSNQTLQSISSSSATAGRDQEKGSLVKMVREDAASIVQPLRTLKNDLQDIIRARKISVVRAAALESGAHAAPHTVSHVRQRGRRVASLVYVAGTLFLAGAVALVGIYLFGVTRTTTPPVSRCPQIIFAEGCTVIKVDSLSMGDLKRVLQGTRALDAPLSSIVQVVLTRDATGPDGIPSEQPLSLNDFLQAIGAHASQDLVQALDSMYFLGIHVANKNAPLLVVPVQSYERAFAGMLAWEKNLDGDLAPLFSEVSDQAAGPDGLPLQRAFTDLVMQNYDIRALKDDSGNVVLYYSFLNRKFLIIAENPYSFNEVLLRLRAERKL